MKKMKLEKMKRVLEELGCDISIFSRFDFYEVGRIVFAVPHEPRSVMEKMGEVPYAAGMEMGRFRDGFEISLPAAGFASPHSRRKTVVNDLGEKLFTYGRDVFLENVISSCKGLCFVVNARGECLGLGYLDEKMLENRLDVGSYLRGFGERR